MRIIEFNIENFKGIKNAKIKLNGNKASIYTLVGLNESGKTTILDAINSFRHDVDGIHGILQQNMPSISKESLVPKNSKANFNKTISISAKIKMEAADVEELIHYCERELQIKIESNSIPRVFTVNRNLFFKNSEHVRTNSTWSFFPRIKKKGARKFKVIGSGSEEWHKIIRYLGARIPRIIFFPTFLFNFPEKILISDDETDIEGNEYFKNMIGEALGSLDDPLDLKKHIVDRIMKINEDSLFSAFYPYWMQSDERERVESALEKLSRKITEEIFGRWKEILGSNIDQKELVIEHIVESTDNRTRQVFLKFSVKDGSSRYKISERSLGFRWFFCFLLFTRFLKSNESSGNRIFLFDEPASNLHSRAQNKLLDSLKLVAGESNEIIYSTHSHHLINPLWLETAFIVTNGEPSEDDEVMTGSLGNPDIDIQAIPYKTFIGQNAEKTHYFQPILDRLQYTPSLLEAVNEGILVEGKSDFYILNWLKTYHENYDVDLVPIGGATNASALMSIYLGAGKNFLLLLDSDEEGNKARGQYLKKLPINENHVIQYSEIFEKKEKEIEDLISVKMKEFIANKFNVKKCSKAHIQRAFSSALSGTNDLPEDSETITNLKKLMEALSERMKEN